VSFNESGEAGIFVVGVSVLMPWILRVFLPEANTDIIMLENTIVVKIVVALFNQFRDFAYFYIVIAVVGAIVWKFVHWEKLQVHVNKLLKKIHVPTIHVEVK
jgi:hypothetical protein